MIEFQENQFSTSQADRILTRLQLTPNEWVALPELYEVSGSLAVHSRIDVLRKRGWSIEQQSKRRPGDPRVLSAYRLVVESGAPASGPAI